MASKVNSKQIVKERCANWTANGICLGVDMDNQLNPMRLATMGKPCAIIQSQPCHYFDETVMAGLPREKSK